MRNKNSKSSMGRLSWMLSGVLKSKRAEGYVDTAVKVLIAVVIGALLLFGLYGLMGNIVIPTTTSKVDSMFKLEGHFDGGTGGGGTGGGDTPVTPDPGITRDTGALIPDEAKYTKAGGTTLDGDGTNTIPDAPTTGDIYEEGDYKYTYNKGGIYGTEWSVVVKSVAKTEYGVILSSIAGKPIVATTYAFNSCQKLVVAPAIPNSVTNMRNTFTGCRALTTAPVIPNGVTDMRSTFESCVALKTYTGSTDSDGDFSNYQIPSSVTSMYWTFYGCTALTISPMVSGSVTDMYGAFKDCTSLVTASNISANVTDMSETFSGCRSLTVAPTIPGSVTKMASTFYSCTNLTTASTIPSSVLNVQRTFYGCTNLAGTIEINSNLPSDVILSKYAECFRGTVKPITIKGSCSKLAEIAATATNGNVTVG